MIRLVRVGVVWFRNDLRLHDHRPLVRALAECDAVVPLFVWDPRIWSRDPVTELQRLGPHRARFWREAVEDLRSRLEAVGGGLWTAVGRPPDVVPQVARKVGADAVYVQAAVADEEARDERVVARTLERDGRSARFETGTTLVEPEDLPFSLAELPDVFTKFRRAVERDFRVADPLPAPTRVPGPPVDVSREEPDWAALGLDAVEPDARAVLPMRGGEGAALARLETYVFEADTLRHYKATRNGLLEADDSSKLSPWLALGCLSPRRVHRAVQRYEAERVANESTYWLIFELLWRDYFQFLSMREGARLFKRSGVGRRVRSWSRDTAAFRAWTEGQTGYPFVDAFMRELAATGFMSNRGRQNVASFLAKDLGVDWRWGASWFERCLVDYDVASNWGNWQYVAGVGTDPRDRRFDVTKQSRDYDPGGAFIKKWVPELDHLGPAAIHAPAPPDRGDYPPPWPTRPRPSEPRSGSRPRARGRRTGRRR
jgi:deoxyribodipyrimidine photo-lyase